MGNSFWANSTVLEFTAIAAASAVHFLESGMTSELHASSMVELLFSKA
jgi:hypothetical protein